MPDETLSADKLLRTMIREALTEGRPRAAEDPGDDAPEYESVDAFALSKDEEDGDSFTHDDLQALARVRHGVPSPSPALVHAIRKELEAYGLKLSAREPHKNVRGVTSSVNGRHPFAGAGGGGSGFSSGWGGGGFTSFGGGPGAIGGGYEWDPKDKKNLGMGAKRPARVKESRRRSTRKLMEGTSARDILEPAVRELVDTLINEPALLTTQTAIDVLDGHFGKIKPGTIITHSDAEKVFKAFDKATRMLGYTTDAERDSLARVWAHSFTARTIPVLRQIATSTAGRPKDAASEGETWGRYLFSPSRSDVPLEANTPDEQAAYDAIWKVLFANKPMPTKVAKHLQKLAANGEYTGMLMPSKYNTFYRGMNHVTDADLTKLLGHTPRDGGGAENVQTTFKPKGSGSSWSVDEEAATLYATALSTDPINPEKGNREGMWSVLMHAGSDVNQHVFLLNPDMLYAIDDFAGNEEQDNESSSEVYAVGPVKLSKVTYWSNRAGSHR